MQLCRMLFSCSCGGAALQSPDLGHPAVHRAAGGLPSSRLDLKRLQWDVRPIPNSNTLCLIYCWLCGFADYMIIVTVEMLSWEWCISELGVLPPLSFWPVSIFFLFYFIFYFYFCCCCWRGEWNSLAVDGISCCRTALLPEVSPNWCKSDQNPDPAYSDGDYLGSKQSYLCQI